MVQIPGIAIYGSVEIERVFCEDCKTMTFVIDEIKQCCGNEELSPPETVYKMSGSRNKRFTHRSVDRSDIVKNQNNLCLYCGKEFGYFYLRNGKVIKSTIHIDHVIPFSFSQNNRTENRVACCNLCNTFKAGKIFSNLNELKEHLDERRKNKRIKILS